MDMRDLLGQPMLPASFPIPTDRPFTRATAYREAGLTWRDLAWLVAHGFLNHPIKGVYVASAVPDSIELRLACLRLVAPPDAVLVDRHAGWVHGGDMLLHPNEHLNLSPLALFLPAGRGRLRNKLTDSGERSLSSADVMEIGGLRVTTPIRTAWDLGRHRWPDRSLSGVDQMLSTGTFSKDELLAGLVRFRGQRWVTTLRVVAPLGDGRAASPPESVVRLRCIEAHMPDPTPQLAVRAGGELLGYLDVGCADLRLGVEYDGDEWHSTPDQLAHDRDRRRRMQQEAGFMVLALRKENLYGAKADADVLIRRALADARRRMGIVA